MRNLEPRYFQKLWWPKIVLNQLAQFAVSTQAPNMVYRPLNRFINRPRQLCCIRNCSKLQYVYKYLIACLISTAVNVCNNVLSF